uniref:ATP synthase subunit a n=1 Tax=Megalodontes quinquecinctus TaxID=2491145 RepID=A0A3S8V0U6_9HYME|nr:ATP synthase F0 subunit 6 [Megalodontes quinquecinctus]
MMTNLFSIFDPSSLFNISLNWLSTLMSMIFIPMMFWMIPSRSEILWNKMINLLHKEMNLLMNNKSKGLTLNFISLFTLIFLSNFIGLFPYIFTPTSHISMNLILSLPLWLTLMFFGWINYSNNMFSHLVPQGTPKILMPFMVCIESISNMIRPMTLAIRLSANMIAGHLLLSLMGNSGKFNMFLSILIITQIILLMLEFAVSIIQAYVFSILSILYTSEIN